MRLGAGVVARATLCGALLFSAGCAAAQSEAPVPPARPGDAASGAATAGAATTGGATAVPAEDFPTWKAGFRARALAAGIRGDVFDAAFRGVTVNARVLELDRYQPEFTRPIWEYLDSAVSDKRVADGRMNAAERRALLDSIAGRFQVDPGVVVAIWGIESAYGAQYGDIPVIESLATLAYEGRRRDFAEQELLAALRILQNGDVTPGRMVGSWAGAMGHTQFIPSSFEAYAVDFGGDGKRDVWSTDPSDALASAAAYLSRYGWRKGEPAAIRVELPAGFDYTLADDETRKTPAEWEALGVRRAGGGTLPASDSVTLLLPAGAGGPAFAAYPNFRVIKRYNNATSYALAVTLLAGQVDQDMRFGQSLSLGWPRTDRPLSRSETEELQRRLTALGYDTQGVDGIVGPNTRSAIRRFQAAQGMVPDGYLSASLLERVRAAGG